MTNRCRYCGADISHRQRNAKWCNSTCYERDRWPRRKNKANSATTATRRPDPKAARNRNGRRIATAPLGRFVTPEQVRGGTAAGGARWGHTEQLGGML